MFMLRHPSGCYGRLSSLSLKTNSRIRMSRNQTEKAYCSRTLEVSFVVVSNTASVSVFMVMNGVNGQELDKCYKKSRAEDLFSAKQVHI
jgi:hypothetical protein